MHGDSNSVAQPIIELSGAIQFQDITRQKLSRIGRSIYAVAHHFRGSADALEAGTPSSGDLAGLVASIHERYVMADQRDARRGEPAENRETAIELF